jgi:hypothetical protein
VKKKPTSNGNRALLSASAFASAAGYGTTATCGSVSSRPCLDASYVIGAFRIPGAVTLAPTGPMGLQLEAGEPALLR